MNGYIRVLLVIITVSICGIIYASSDLLASGPISADSVVIKLKSNDKLYKVDLIESEKIDEVIDNFIQEPNIEFIVPNFEYAIATEPNDPRYDSQWYFEKIDAPTAWDYETGKRSITVAVLDTGIDLTHPDIVNNLWENSGEVDGNNTDDDGNGYIDDYYGWDFVNEAASPLPKFDSGWNVSGIHHGTAVAGVVGAEGNNKQGITGMNWRVKLMNLRVLNSAGVGDTRDIYQGIRYAIANGTDFINLSFVGENKDSLLTQAINEATEAGVVVLAAAGNDSVDLNINPRYPVCNDNVIGVAGTDQQDNRWVVDSSGGTSSGSNYGSDCVDISAPGYNFVSTVFYNPANGLESYYLGGWSGTSLATPLVTGAMALLKAHNSTLTSLQAAQIVLNNNDALSNLNATMQANMGGGRLNIGNAFKSLLPVVGSVLTGAGSTGGPHVRIFSDQGIRQVQFFAYAESFRGGVNVAAGDLDGDGIEEVIVGAGNGGGPHVRIFDQDGNLQDQFFAYAESFRGGVNVAAGDLDGDGIEEVIVGAGNGGGPHVRIFDQDGNLQDQFFAYAESFRGGVNVAAGDLDGDGIEEVIVGAGNGGGPHVRIFDQDGNLQDQFFAYAESFRGGVNVAAGDLDGDGIEEVIVGAGNGGGPHVRIFDQDGNLQDQFFAYAESFRGGVNVAAGDLDGDGIEEVIVGAGNGGGPHVRIFDQDGNLQDQFFAYAESFRGGVLVASIK